MITSYIRTHTYLYYFLSISPRTGLEQAALLTFNGVISNFFFIFFLASYSRDAFSRVKVVRLFLHPSNRFLFSFPLKSLRSRLNERARSTRQWSFVLRACLLRPFPNSSPRFFARHGRSFKRKSWRRVSNPRPPS